MSKGDDIISVICLVSSTTLGGRVETEDVYFETQCGDLGDQILMITLFVSVSTPTRTKGIGLTPSSKVVVSC